MGVNIHRDNHGIQRVGDGNHSRQEGDIFACQTIWVPTAIPTLMMVQNNRYRRSQEGNIADQLSPNQGVLAHFDPFFIRQGAGLA